MIVPGAHTVGCRPAPRLASCKRCTTRVKSTATGNRAAMPSVSGDAVATCPFAAMARALDGGQRDQRSALMVDEMPIPGPRPFSLQSLNDVLTIFTSGGLHAAQLHFAQKYGPICRWVMPRSQAASRSDQGLAAVAASNPRLTADSCTMMAARGAHMHAMQPLPCSRFGCAWQVFKPFLLQRCHQLGLHQRPGAPRITSATSTGDTTG
jgi:hypothetical protein